MPPELPELERGEVPPELLQRIDNLTLESGVEDLGTRRGLINKLLNTIFWRDKWLIDPRALFYKSALEVHPDDQHGIANAEDTEVIYSDFVVFNYMTSSYEDVPHLVLNIKREAVSMTTELVRLDRCLEKIGDNSQVPGFLIVGNMVGEIQRKQGANNGGESTKELELKQLIKITSEEFLNYLRNIASA